MKNNHALVHEHLEQLIIHANQIAADATEKLIVNLKLQELSEEGILLKLHNELKKLNQEIADFEYPEYIFLAKYKETLFRLFYGRLLFYEKNDSERIKEAIILSNKKNELLKKYLAQQKVFSDFTLDDFMNGKSNVIFYRLKQRPPGTSEEECNKMRAWQTDKLLQLIQLETNHFIETFRKNSVQDNGDIKLLDVEIEEIKLLFKRPADFAPNSKKIKALKNTLLPENLSGMTDDFIHFVDGEMDFSNLTPQNLQKAISEYLNTKTKKPVSFTPVIFYSLIIYGDWLEKVKNGELKINQNLNLDYSSLFQKTWEKGIIQSEEHIKKFKKENDLKPITANEYKEIVFKRLDNLRYAFNELSNENYYNLLTDKETLKISFVSNCIFNRNPEVQAKELIQSIIINEETVFLHGQLEKYFADLILMKPKEVNLQLQLQIIDLINSMVPDSATIKKVLALLDNTMNHLRRGRKPVLFILRDLKEELSEIYHITEKRIIRLIDNADLEKGLEYCRQEIKELKRKMLKAENQKCSYHQNLEHLKKLLQIEVDCNNQIVKEKPVDMTRLLKTHKTKVKKLTFGLNHSKAQQLEKILNALCVHIDLLDNQSEVKDLMEVFKAEDLTKIDKKIYLGCKTNEFAYIRIKLKPFFKSFSPTNIHNSKLFVSVYGNEITRDNLYNAEYDLLLKKDKIDNIFSQIQ